MSTRTLSYSSLDIHTPKGRMASGVDRDAFAFLTAAQIYNTNQIRAIVNLVTSLKRVGLWSKLRAIYPFVGGTAESHKWNLKDPRDSNAAYRLQFFGGWTHSSTGADPNGTNAYADTNLAQNVLAQTDAHISFYSREGGKGLWIEIGVTDATSPVPASFIFGQFTDNKMYGVLNQRNDLAGFSAVVTDSKGLFLANKTTGTVVDYYRNGVTIGSQTNVTSVDGCTDPYYLGACRRKVPAGNPSPFVDTYSPRELAFSTLGSGLTTDDQRNLYNIVDLYQRRLGRNV